MQPDGDAESPPIAPIDLETQDIAQNTSLDIRTIPETEDGEGTCQGQLIEWNEVWSTYNFTNHANPRVNLPWTPHSIDKEGKWIRLQSRECVLRLRNDAERESRACKKCCRIVNHPRLHELLERASLPDLPKRTDHAHLNPTQMARLVKRLTIQVKRLKLDVCLFCLCAAITY